MTTTSRKSTARRRDHEPLSSAILIEGESPDHFYALLDRLATELQPANLIEWQIIDTMAAHKWRQIRFTSMRIATESQTNPAQTKTEKHALLNLLTRQETHHARRYKAAMRTLKTLLRFPPK
jgi:hypothetical protein